ncbi:hypothetical protein H6F43_03210 [Leptolyngbya sp. FACHB-36]|uniref:hypothetical protein n=1 Tax=Leptolyngbya sp. FACHB-36 TaxID=2692808 RepID=UPI0016813B65|nr:hypothetical protein [Leptolyngbya sp. FACHB-36]MBD2019192.1 hypothetical protein [Leptolyngbya sp. FACHB-36]
MARFLLGNPKKIEESVNVKTYFFHVDFPLPESFADTTPALELYKRFGIHTVAFCYVPNAGDLFDFQGCEWRIVGRKHFAHKIHARGERLVSQLFVEFVQPSPPNFMEQWRATQKQKKSEE